MSITYYIHKLHLQKMFLISKTESTTKCEHSMSLDNAREDQGRQRAINQQANN